MYFIANISYRTMSGVGLSAWHHDSNSAAIHSSHHPHETKKAKGVEKRRQQAVRALNV